MEALEGGTVKLFLKQKTILMYFRDRVLSAMFCCCTILVIKKIYSFPSSALESLHVPSFGLQQLSRVIL